MKNEIGRKITSLTLMTIMLVSIAGAFPSAMPEAAAANQYLFVSAENSVHGNQFYGPQVVEIVINDSDINRLDVGVGMPDVTVNGKTVLMAQAADGSWYGYIADKTFAQNVDSLYGTQAGGINFGYFCSQATELAFTPNNATNNDVPSLKASDSVGIAIPYALAVSAKVDGKGTLSDCGMGLSTGRDLHLKLGEGTRSFYSTQGVWNESGGLNNTVIREFKSLVNQTSTTSGTKTFYGQIGLGPNLWPFVQLYSFTQFSPVVVQYNKGGVTETVNLTFDQTDDSAGVALDRAVHPMGSDLMITLTDWQLNIDPTDEDSWSFGTTTTNATAFYNLFDENGVSLSDTKTNSDVGLTEAQMSSTLGHNVGVMKIDADAQSVGTNVIAVQDNADSIVQSTNDLGSGVCNGATTVCVTFTETGANTGVFRNFDEDNKANVIIQATAKRGTSATLVWDETTYSIVAGLGWGSVNMDVSSVGDEWNSGEALYVTIEDEDMNMNTRKEDQMKITDNKTIVPSIKLGSPITLDKISKVMIVGNNRTNAATSAAGTYQTFDTWTSGTNCSTEQGSTTNNVNCVSKFSDIAYATVPHDMHFTNHDALVFQWSGVTVQNLKDQINDVNGSRNAGYTYINYDFRGLNGGSDDSNAYINFTISDTTSLNSNTVNSRAKTTETDRFGSGLAGVVLIDGVESNSGAATNQAWTMKGLTMTDDLVIWANISSTNSSVASTSAGAETMYPLGAGTSVPLVLDIWTFGQDGDGVPAGNRTNDMIIRAELEETDVNTGLFEGTLEYIMLNQLNVNATGTYNATVGYSNDPVFIVNNDMTDEDSIRMNYLDEGADGVATQVADQVEAPTHSGVVEFNADTYKIADTAVITLTDMDLNTDSEVIDIYTVVQTSTDKAYDHVGKPYYGQNSVGDNFGRLMSITFDDEDWVKHNEAGTSTSATCSGAPSGGSNGPGAAGFTLVETGLATGIFTGDFQIPEQYCKRATSSVSTNSQTSVTGKDIEVNYVDYRNSSGEIIEVGDGAGVRGNSGSVSLDRTVYPVPFGKETIATDVTDRKTPNGRSLFPIHESGIDTTNYINTDAETLGQGNVIIHIRVDDPDYDVSATGEDTIGVNSSTNRGPLKMWVSRGSADLFLGTAGGDQSNDGKLSTTYAAGGTHEYGPISETAPDSGVFEFDLTVEFTDGPESADCPSKTSAYTALNGKTTTTRLDRFSDAQTSGKYNCILQGDIFTVEYTDTTDASGNSNTATDSATFDLRNGVLQTDKSVYVIGSDMIMTLIEPDLDLDNDEAETWDLDVIEWDSDAAEISMGNKASIAGGSTDAAAFDPEPSDFRETGDSTGIFQIVVEIPSSLNGNKLDRGEKIDLEYQDWGPSGAKYVGDEKQDVNVTVFTSNFGATIELDQKVYTWTDKVYITIVAPDHNFDSDLVDQIGDTTDDPLVIQTRDAKLTGYKLAETGTDTGIFSGEVILTGFKHDADGDSGTGDSNGNDITSASTDVTGTDSGPTDGKLGTTDDDGLTVSYEFNEDETVVGSALIRWNVGETSWLESSYPATGTGVIRVVDPDMNWDPEAVDNFKIDVWSDSDAGGISLTVSETNEATGIFEGTVSFTVTDESSGHRLRVSEGDTVTAEYEDNTLPQPYTKSDDLDITGTTMIGTIIPPLERAPAANARVVDAFGNSLAEVSVDQQVQIEADLVNGQDKDQSFAYLVQVQDESGVTVSLAWITGQLAAGQSFSPALSWIPSDAGLYTATVFVWESVDNPTALSPTVSVDINVI